MIYPFSSWGSSVPSKAELQEAWPELLCARGQGSWTGGWATGPLSGLGRGPEGGCFSSELSLLGPFFAHLGSCHRSLDMNIWLYVLLAICYNIHYAPTLRQVKTKWRKSVQHMCVYKCVPSATSIPSLDHGFLLGKSKQYSWVTCPLWFFPLVL